MILELVQHRVENIKDIISDLFIWVIQDYSYEFPDEFESIAIEVQF